MLKIKDSFKFIFDKLMRSLERFPMTLLVTMAFVIVSIVLIHADYNADYTETLERMLMAITLAVPLTACAKLISERLKQNQVQTLVVQFAALTIAGIYYWLMPEDINEYFVMRFMALWMILFFGFLMAPYFYKRLGLAQYILHLAGKFFLTSLFSVVLFGGLSMMVFTIEALFNVNWWDEVYIDLFFIIAGTFGMTHFLGCIPEIETQLTRENYSKIFKSLFLYILLPIVSVYTVILYAYFIKILIGFKLPEGIIGNLVLWYALVSVGTLFFVRDLRDEVKWLEKFMKVYIPLMTVPLGMLFLAIFIRIDAYGLTMPRYFVVALGVFSVVNLIIMWFKKTDTAVVNMVVLMTMIGITFFGTLSGYQLTLADQTHRLETLLENQNMLDADGKLMANADLDKEQKGIISDKINFLLRTYDVEQIDVLPADFSRNTAKLYLGFEIDPYNGYDNFTEKYFSYYQKGESKVIAIKDADYMVSVNRQQRVLKTTLGETYTIEKTEASQILTLKKGQDLVMEIDLDQAAAAFYVDQSKPVELKNSDETITVLVNFMSIDGLVLNEVTPKTAENLEVQYFDASVFINIEQP